MVVFINMCDAANVEVIETRELLEEMGFSEGKLKVEMITYNKTGHPHVRAGLHHYQDFLLMLPS